MNSYKTVPSEYHHCIFKEIIPLEENCALLDYYAASSGSSVTTFQDNLSFPSSRVTCILSNILSQQVYEYEFSGKYLCRSSLSQLLHWLWLFAKKNDVPNRVQHF
jgi:hypothetical protein